MGVKKNTMTFHYEITPEIEQRLASWIKHNDSIGKGKDRKPKLPCITISYEMGCDALSLAKNLKKILSPTEAPEKKWILVTDELIYKMYEEATPHARDLKNMKQMNSIFQSLLTLVFNQHITTEYDFNTYKKNTVSRFSSLGHSIILACGGSIIAQDLTHCFHIRLVSQLEERIKTIMDSKKIKKEEALSLIKQKEKNEKRYLQFIDVQGEQKTKNPSFYHLTVNFNKFQPLQIANIIAKALENNLRDPGNA